jgi:Ca-activated chloride channel family protein
MRGILIAAALVVLGAPLHAQGWIEPLPGRPGGGVMKVRTSVQVRVVDRIAHVEVEEWFRNEGRGLGEGDYLFPMPGEAVFREYSLFQGDAELRGETMDAERARRIYEEIVRRKKDPALIELVGKGLVRARVFPIQAGETRRIILRYTQVLDRNGDALRFRYLADNRSAYPHTIEPRPGLARPGPGRLIAGISFTLDVENEELYRDAFSPTHQVRVTREDGRMRVRPEGVLSGDFTLFLPFAERPVGITVATHRPSGEDGYFLLTLSPAEGDAAVRVPRDVTAVVDVSGSMSGEKMEQARQALLQLLGTLGPDDRFRLIRFSSNVQAYRPEWTRATAAEVRAARIWVEDLRAEGGTNIAGALEEAFRAETPAGRIPFVLFMTDGLPSVGETEPERIASAAERARGEARVFAFGVGYDVNTYLLDRLGAAGRGGAQYVQPGEDVEQAVSALATKIRFPVLADLVLGRAPVRLTEIYPRELPDLYAGEELVIFGRYALASERRDADGALEITGQRNGRTERFSSQVAFASHTLENDYIPRLWASRKLGELTRQVRLNGAHAELIDEIRQTALRYGLLSEYTSYLVLEPNVVAADLQGRPAPGARGGGRGAVGQSAVAAAERSRRERDVTSLDQVRENEVAKAMEDGSGRMVVAGRTFVSKNGEWEDVMHRTGTRVVEIEQYSAAYFGVLQRLPELEQIWKQLPDVLVAGRDVSIRVGARGTTSLTAAQLNRLVTEFRAR